MLETACVCAARVNRGIAKQNLATVSHGSGTTMGLQRSPAQDAG